MKTHLYQLFLGCLVCLLAGCTLFSKPIDMPVDLQFEGRVLVRGEEGIYELTMNTQNVTSAILSENMSIDTYLEGSTSPDKIYSVTKPDILVNNQTGDNKPIYSGKEINCPRWNGDSSLLLFEYENDIVLYNPASGKTSLMIQGISRSYCEKLSAEGACLGSDTVVKGEVSCPYWMDESHFIVKRLKEMPPNVPGNIQVLEADTISLVSLGSNLQVEQIENMDMPDVIAPTMLPWYDFLGCKKDNQIFIALYQPGEIYIGDVNDLTHIQKVTNATGNISPFQSIAFEPGTCNLMFSYVQFDTDELHLRIWDSETAQYSDILLDKNENPNSGAGIDHIHWYPVWIGNPEDHITVVSQDTADRDCVDVIDIVDMDDGKMTRYVNDDKHTCWREVLEWKP